MTYQVSKDYGEESRNALPKQYCVESLERELQNANDDLREIRLFIMKADHQLHIAKSTPLKYYVEFRKEFNYATKHINYIILIFQLPDIPDADKVATRMYVWRPEDVDGRGTHNKPFLGNEKKSAVEYAVALSIKYHAKVVGNAADLVKPAKEVIKL